MGDKLTLEKLSALALSQETNLGGSKLKISYEDMSILAQAIAIAASSLTDQEGRRVFVAAPLKHLPAISVSAIEKWTGAIIEITDSP